MPRFEPSTLAHWTRGRWNIWPREAPDGVSTDSRVLQPGQLFVALRGDRFDGHRFLSQAFSRGAAAALVDAEEALPPDIARCPLIRVADTKAALLAMAAGWRRRLNAHIIGITGSVGKTTVKDLTAALLKTVGRTAATRGNWNNDIGLPLSLLAAEPDTRYGVFEVGMNRPGEIAALCEVLAPTHAVMTTVGAAHLEAFDSEAAIAAEKASLFRALPPDGLAVICRDQPWFDLLRAAAPGRTITTSSRHPADYRWRRNVIGDHTFRLTESASGTVHEFRAALPGEAFVQNVILAIAIAREFDVAWADCRQVAATFEPGAMRWNQRNVAGVIVINDGYNANPLSMAEALRSLSEIEVRGRRWVVLGDMLELGDGAAELHRDVGRRAGASGIDGLVLLGRWAGTMRDGARDAGLDPQRIEICPDGARAADVLRNWIRPDDAVLFKASRALRLERVLEAWEASLGSVEPPETSSCCTISTS